MNHIEKLNSLLDKKLENEWNNKWKNFGSIGKGKYNRRSKFYETLAADISAKSGIKVSRDTVQRFNKAEGGNSKYTLDAISKYLGFEDFDSFQQEGQSKGREVWLKSFGYWWLIIPFFLVAFFVFNKFYLEPKEEKITIENVIFKANEIQFKAFEKLDTLGLYKLYTKDGSAKKGIITVIDLARQNNRWISHPNNNPSCFKILDSKVLEHTDSTALVKTEEQWFLKWYDLDDERYTVSYDKRNTQYYELRKENEQWKIHNNFYEGKASPIDF